MIKSLRLVMGDQLSLDLPSLKQANLAEDCIIMAELPDEAGSVPHHKRKIAFIFSAMRHFAKGLEEEGFNVDYVKLGEVYCATDKPCRSFTDFVQAAIAKHQPERLVVTAPSEWRVAQMVKDWVETLDIPVIIMEDTRFIASHERFEAWANDGRKTLRMEYFYRLMRRETGLLMDGDDPEGGQWNYDHDNRSRLPAKITLPKRPNFMPDAMTQEVIELVAQKFAKNFGSLTDFNHPVTRGDALDYLDWFIAQALPDFGTYQDAMKQDEALMFHSHLSALINCGLLGALECCQKAEDAYRAGHAPINAVEGFIRQMIGWREFIRGIYWLKMPEYGDQNFLGASRNLPEFYWTADTKMNCLRQSVKETRDNAYAHHIQRLMVLGNFALLAGLDPKQVQQWFLIVYHDAYEWVEMPNVVGMALFADGGLFASKPYAASGAYIDKMSDYCKGCHYKVKQKTGEGACPFNYLYWDFIARNEAKLSGNARMAMIYRSYEKMDETKRATITNDAAHFLENL